MPDIRPTRSHVELWSKIRQLLSDSGSSTEDTTASLATLYDQLSVSRREFVSFQMLSNLREVLDPPERFAPIHFRILELASPYLSRSDIKIEALTVLSGSFQKEKWNRPLVELQAIVHGL